MICPECEGTGRKFCRLPTENPFEDLWDHLPCPLCQGSKVHHCCDGDKETDFDKNFRSRNINGFHQVTGKF